MQSTLHTFPRLGFLLPALWLTLLAAGAASARTAVVFRYDDYVGKQTDTPGLGKPEDRLRADKIALRAFIARGLPVTVAIVPYAAYDGKTARGPLTEDEPRMKLLREAIAAGVCEPALRSLAADGAGARYVRRGYDDEAAAIGRGKADLEAWLGVAVSVMAPPERRYDGATARAAAAAGIKIISDGAGPAYRPVATWVPALSTGPTSLDTIRKAAAYQEDSLIVVALRPSDFKVNDALGTAQFDETSFDEYLAAISQLPGVEVLAMPAAAAKYADLVSARHQATLHTGLQVMQAGGLYGPLVRGMWGDRPRDVAWATSVWDPLARKKYLPHVVLGLLSLVAINWLWSLVGRFGQVRLLLLLGPAAAGIALLPQASSGPSPSFNAQAALVALVIATLYSASRYADMVARQVRRMRAM